MNETNPAIEVKRDAPKPAARRHPLAVLRGEIDRLFDGIPWSTLGMPRTRGVAGLDSMRDWMACFRAMPALDLVERDGGFELSAKLPGMTAADVELSLSDGMLVLKGEKSAETSQGEGDYHVRERSYGALPAGIDTDKVSARFENGVLKVTLPKSAAARQAERRIEVASA